MDVKESQVYITIIIAVIIFGFTIGYFYYSIIKQNKRVRTLERINAEAQIQVLEKDRRRIAEDLHDDIAPLLTTIQAKIDSFKLAEYSDKHARLETSDQLNELAQRMRDIAFDLMPSVLPDNGLLRAIDQFVNRISTGKTLSIRLVPPTTEIIIDERKAVHVFRMIKEIIHNTIKHAHASELLIVLSREKGYLIVSSRDNGIGFDYQQKLQSNDGLGLKSLMNRVYLLQADFLIDSQQDKGTSITIRVPY